MKKVILLLVAAVFTMLSAVAQTENDLVISAGDAKELVLGDDMNVVLVPATSQQEIQLSKAMLLKMDVKFYNGKAEIMPRKDLRSETVYVVINKVKEIVLGENTAVRSEDILQNGRLEIYFHRGATARIRTSGKVDAYSLGDFEVTITRKPILSVSSASIN